MDGNGTLDGFEVQKILHTMEMDFSIDAAKEVSVRGGGWEGIVSDVTTTFHHHNCRSDHLHTPHNPRRHLPNPPLPYLQFLADVDDDGSGMLEFGEFAGENGRCHST